MTHGVTSKEMRGIHKYVTQEELKSKKIHIDTSGTSKTSVMEGGPICTNLIEARVYNTNPFHCIIMVSY